MPAPHTVYQIKGFSTEMIEGSTMDQIVEQMNTFLGTLATADVLDAGITTHAQYGFVTGHMGYVVYKTTLS